jgi:heme/copper-type cytochrome/quinol oxidase subunit 2
MTETEAGQAAATGLVALIAAMWVLFLIIAAVAIVIAVFYCLTLQSCLKAVPEEKRQMKPGMVWLLFIPLFNIVWQFIVVLKIAESVRNVLPEENGGKTLGLVMCICNILGIVPVVNFVAGPAGLICWIIYWVTVAGLRKKVEAAVAQAPAAA